MVERKKLKVKDRYYPALKNDRSYFRLLRRVPIIRFGGLWLTNLGYKPDDEYFLEIDTETGIITLVPAGSNG